MCPPPPPPRYTSSNISRTPWATVLKLSEILNELICKTKYYFQPPSTTVGYHSNNQSWCMFFKSHFGTFHAYLTRTRRFCAVSMNSVPNVVCCGNLGLIVRLMASWWQFSFYTVFCASTTLNWAILSPWQQERCHSTWFFISFQKKYFCWLLTRGTRFLIFE